MRLVDADKIINHIYEYFEDIMDVDDVLNVIRGQPTQYDVNKVVHNLENMDISGITDIDGIIDMAIDIVRAGGRNG